MLSQNRHELMSILMKSYVTLAPRLITPSCPTLLRSDCSTADTDFSKSAAHAPQSYGLADPLVGLEQALLESSENPIETLQELKFPTLSGTGLAL